MAQDWHNYYSESPTYSAWLQATLDSDMAWPDGVQIHHNKLYHQVKPCVPEGVHESFLQELHCATGHVGVARLLKDLTHRYVLEDMKSAAQQLTSIRRICKCAVPVTLHIGKWMGWYNHFSFLGN